MVRRNDFSGLPGVRPPVERAALRLEVELELDSGDLSDGLGLDGVRSLDAPYGDAALGVSEETVLGFGMGRGGNDPDGLDREGCGNVDIEAMILPVTKSMSALDRFSR
jgi:hypothetical protein